MKSLNRKTTFFIVFMILCIYYLAIGIFFLCTNTTSLSLRVCAVVIPAVLTAVSMGLLIQQIVISAKISENHHK